MVYVFQVVVVLACATLLAFAVMYVFSRYEKEIFSFIERFDAWAKRGK